ncbi:MAG: hypothetical protein ACEQSQ_11755 [Candidatus Paceibacteria bacterium]
MVKIDLQTERTPQQWQSLLDTVKRNDDSVLTKIEQSYYIEQIEFKLGIRNKHLEVLKEIEAGMADIDDLK